MRACYKDARALGAAGSRVLRPSTCGLFIAARTIKRSYASQSDEISGILKQVREMFENSLSDAQKDGMAT